MHACICPKLQAEPAQEVLPAFMIGATRVFPYRAWSLVLAEVLDAEEVVNFNGLVQAPAGTPKPNSTPAVRPHYHFHSIMRVTDSDIDPPFWARICTIW